MAAPRDPRALGRPLDARRGPHSIAGARGALAEPRRLPSPPRLRRYRRRGARRAPLARARRRSPPPARGPVPRGVVEPVEADRGRPVATPAGASAPVGERVAPPPREVQGIAPGPAGAAR